MVAEIVGKVERFDFARRRGVLDGRAPTLSIFNAEDEEETVE